MRGGVGVGGTIATDAVLPRLRRCPLPRSTSTCAVSTSRSPEHFRRCRTILEIVPDAEQGISYRVPAFRIQGKVVAGCAAFKDHLSYLPFSGSVLGQLGDELREYTMTKSALHFPVDRPLPKQIVERLIAVRLAEMR
jgi:uncharacterized protein YdhG (YjbR/CyaY superfamily)